MIADASVIELSKENILPLATGRRATVLQAVLTGGAKHDGLAPDAAGPAPTTPQRPGATSNPVSPSQNPNPDLERQRLDFERQVTDPSLLDSDDDPLEIHYRYVRWLLEHYTTGNNSSSRTLNVLERTLETFKRDGRYKNDPRHLRLWLTYKDMVRDPLDVFRWLHTNDVLQELAGFYEGWAGCLESRGRYKDADAMYQLGIHRRAQPLERLQRRYLEFQRRMMTASAPPDEEPPLDENPTQRTALGSMGPRASTIGNENSRGGNDSRAASGRGVPVKAVPPPQQPQTKPGKMAIFSDPDGTASQPAQPGSWPELGTQQQRNRENLREKEKWTDVKIPSAAPVPNGKIQVWSDESAERPLSAPHPVAPGAPVLREKAVLPEASHGLLSSSGSTAAAEPPAPSSSTQPPAPRSSSAKPATSKQRSAPQAALGERAAVAFHMVYPPSSGISFENGESGAKKCEEEKSFEEIRAERKYGLLGYVSDSEPDSAGEEEEMDDEVSRYDYEKGYAGSTCSRHFDTEVAIGDDGKLDPTITINLRDKRKSMASPTINTKKAMKDVYEMFSGDLDDDQDYYSAPPEEDDTRPVPVFQQPMGKKLAIFQDSDENAAPSGAGKLAIFRDSDPPTVTASNPPKSKFTVFSDADAEPIPPKPRIPLGLRAAESTAPSASSSSRATGSSDAYDNDTTSSAKPPSAPVRSILKSSGARPRSFEADEEANPFASTSASSGDSNDEDTETLTRSLRENLPSTARNQSLTRKEVLNLAKDIADEAEADEEELMRAEAQRRLVLERERILDQQHQQAVQMGGMMVPLGPRIPEMPTIYDPSLTPITERTEPSSRATGTTTAGNSSMAYSASVLSGTSGRPSFIANERTFAHESEPTSTLSLTRVLKNSLHHGILEEVEGEEVDPLVGANTSFQRLAISGGGPYDPYLDEPMKRYVSACMDSDKQMIVRRNDSLLQRGSKLVSGAEIPLIGTSETLVLERKLGEGGYGVVWLASCVDATAVQSDDSDDDFSSSQFSLRLDRDPRDKKAKRSKGSLRAVKLSNSKSRIINLTYEQCLLRTARTRLAAAGSNALASLITTYDCRVYADTAILRMDFIAGGSLLDIVNVAMTADPLMAHASTGQSAGMEEIVAVFYAIEVLKTVDALHSVDVVHGDIKPENFLARWSRGGRQNDDTVSSIRAVPDEWTSFYDPSGDGGWGDRGLFIVDFGRALDLRTVAADSAGKERCFFTDFDASGKGDPAVEAWELRNKEPFHGFEIDWYGIAGVVHVLLFGKFMEITEGEPGSGLAPGSKKPEIMIATLHAMKRYWQTEEIWIPLFATLLNPPEPYATAGRAAVQSLIRKMQKWLEANCQKGGKNLRASLKKLELTVMEKSGKRAAQASSRGFGGSSVGGRSGLPVLRK